MVNVLIPACADTIFWGYDNTPKTLFPVNGEPMIQRAAENFANVEDVHYIFMLRQDEVDNYHIDEVVRGFAGDKADIIVLQSTTKGSLCTCLMAIDLINNDDELIIANYDHVLMDDVYDVIGWFRKESIDCGVATFKSNDKRWMYVQTDGKNVARTAPRRPISRQAIAGFYYYKHGKDFVEAAKNAIRKRYTYSNLYFLTGAVDGMILNNKKVQYYELENNYYRFYDKEKVIAYESEVNLC